MGDVLAGLGARSAPIERAPESISAAQRQGWEVATLGEIRNGDNSLVAALPPRAGDLRGAELADYARTNPLIVIAWSGPRGFVQLTDEERETALRALQNGTSFAHEQQFLGNEARISEFSAGLDEVMGRFRFNPSGALYELYKNGVFSYADMQQDAQLREGYTDALMGRLSGVEGLDFGTALDEEKEFRSFLQGFVSLLSDGDYYSACLYGLPQFASQNPDGRMYGIMASAIEEYAGIPQELLKEQASGWISRPFTEEELKALFRDGRVSNPADRDWALPPGQSDVSESARAMRLFMTELAGLQALPEPEKAVKYAYLYNLWTIAQSDDLLQNVDACTMAREFYRVTGMEINSDSVRSAWEQNRYAMR